MSIQIRAMVVPSSVLEVVIRLQDHGHRAYLVGGCCRDFLLGKEPKDYDVATSAPPSEVMQIFPHVIPTGIDFGIVTVVGEHNVEVAMRGFIPFVIGAFCAAWAWQGSLSFAIMVGCITMALATD